VCGSNTEQKSETIFDKPTDFICLFYKGKVGNLDLVFAIFVHLISPNGFIHIYGMFSKIAQNFLFGQFGGWLAKGRGSTLMHFVQGQRDNIKLSNCQTIVSDDHTVCRAASGTGSVLQTWHLVQAAAQHFLEWRRVIRNSLAPTTNCKNRNLKNTH